MQFALVSIAVSAEAFVIDDDALLQSDILVRRSSESVPLMLLRRIRRIGTVAISAESDILEVCTFVSSFLLMTVCLLIFVRWAENAQDVGKDEVRLNPVATFAQFLEAIKVGDSERCRALLQAHPELLHRRDVAGNTVLHVAAESGASDVLQLCLRADVDARNLRRETPLHAAARAGELCCIIALLDAGADLDAEDAQGATPVVVAAEAQQRSVCQLLLDSGASPLVPEPPALLEELLDELYHVPLRKERSQSSLSTTDGESWASDSPTTSSSSSEAFFAEDELSAASATD